MNLAELVEQYKTRYGEPERGASGTARITSWLNAALAYMNQDPEAPPRLYQFERRFTLEVPREGETLIAHHEDNLVFVLPAPSASATLPKDGTMVARWLEVYDTTTATWVQRRVRDVFAADYTDENGVPHPKSDFITVDRPWDTPGESGLSWRIFTAEYPYPEEVRVINEVLLDPGTTTSSVLLPFDRTMMVAARVGAWRTKTRPTAFADGNYYQLPAPHYTPVGFNSTTNSELWGYDDTAGQHGDPTLPGQLAPQYGAAGIFSYKVVHVWGRRPWNTPTKSAKLQPFYMSAPSKATERVTAYWGGPAIVVGEMPDVEYDLGYGPDSTLPSYRHSGVEKWIFRARHGYEDPTSGNNNAAHKRPQADGVYYLWRIVPGYTLAVVDRGDLDPVDYEFPLVPVHGYHHLMLNSLPDTVRDVWLSGRQKERRLEYDTDVPRAPAECAEAILSLARCFAEGRNGKPVFTSEWFADYQTAMAAMRADRVSPKHASDAFGDGLGTAYGRRGSVVRFDWAG